MKFEIRKGMLLNAFDNFGTYEVTEIYADGDCELSVRARPIKWDDEEGDSYTLLDDELEFNKNELARMFRYESGETLKNIEMIYEGVKYKYYV